MDTSLLKNNLHQLIDSINNKVILERFHELLCKINSTKNGTLWNRLSEEDQKELILAEIDSDDDKNLISYSEMQKKHQKWLK